MPPLRPQPAPVNRGQAAGDLGQALVPPAPLVDLRAMVRDAGGTRAAAQLVGRSPRTVRRWAAGGVQNVPEAARQALQQASMAARNRRLIEAMGGVRRVSQVTGRSVRTVQRWARGEIRRPRLDAEQILRRADAAVRMRDRGLQIDPATGLPMTPVHLQLQGSIRINASRTKGYAYPARNIGTGGTSPLGFELEPQVVAAVVEAIGQDDPEAAQAILEAHLSDSYAAVGSYDQRNQIGLFIDSITSVEFNQEPPPAPPVAPAQPPRRGGRRRR